MVKVGIGTKFARFHYGIDSIVVVKSQTKTQWILSDNTRLRKSDLGVVGAGKWDKVSYRIATNSDIEKVEINKIAYFLKEKVQYSTLDSATLKKLKSIVDEVQSKSKA